MKCTLFVNDLNAEGYSQARTQKITSRDQRSSYEASVVVLRHFIQPEGLFSVLKTDLYRPYLLSQINPVHSPVTQILQIHFNITLPSTIRFSIWSVSRSQWPRGLRRRSAAAGLLRSWVRISPGAWMFVCCEGCVLSGRGLCDGLITRPEESYRLWSVIVCDLETSRMCAPYICIYI